MGKIYQNLRQKYLKLDKNWEIIVITNPIIDKV